MNERLMELLSKGLPKGTKELSQLTGESVRDVEAALETLIAEGEVVRTKKGRYTTAAGAGLVRARVGFQRNGTPLARPVDGGESMQVEVSGAERCMPDDLVLVRPAGLKCALHTILKRGRDGFAAFVRIEQRAKKGAHRGDVKQVATAVPCDLRIPYDVVLTGDLSYVRNDQIARLRIEKYPEYNRPIYASVERVLGGGSSMRALMKAVAEDHDFTTEVSDAVAAEANEMPASVSAEDTAGREDLRELLTFTIDGATAKDFDDAVSIEKLDGGWRLGVHIADVSHYVRPRTAIDEDALIRGTSLYLPGLTVPMLPECLSNHLCSLMPDADRLAMSLFMDIRDGAVTDHRLVESVIHSHARLTYQAVNRLWDGGDADIAPEVQAALADMLELSHVLREKRKARGAIDFEIDEPEFILNDEGEPEDVLCEPRGEAEKMIEDFMLAANETVAALARNTELPFIYRVHEDPDADRLRQLEAFLSGLDMHVHISANPHPGKLQAILEDAKDHPARDVIRQYLLRALKRAQYSEKPLGHFAMAMQDYCHFTSPIRRYPDLTVHRMLKLLLHGDMDKAQRMAKRMPELANECSLRENAATLAERQGDGIMMAAYMAKQVGRKFDGVISGVTGWGLYVTLPNGAEGLVHIAGLDDFYVYDAERSRLVGEATGTVFKLGDRVRVRMESAVVQAGEINFELVPPRQ
ncbi:MAG: ribonuclease R [Clostridia bacterium]|nr:ribonuclease R [Clostridia bacterium]